MATELRRAQDLHGDLKLAALKSGEEKLVAMKAIFKGIHDIEREAMANFGFNLQEVVVARSLLPEVEASINRLEAGRRRSEAIKAAKAAELERKKNGR